MKRIASVMLLGLLLAGCTSAKPARQAALRQDSKPSRPIVFTDGKQLFSVRADGTGLRALTARSKAEAPAWSPRGDRVAFISGEERHLAVVKAAGGRPRIMQTEEDQPIESASGPIAWRPKGETLALNLFEDPMWGSVYYYNLKSRQSTVFWTKQYDNTWESDPSFSPDGEQLVFAWNERTGGDYKNGPQDLWRIDASGKNLAKLYAASGGYVYRSDWGPGLIAFELREAAGWDNTDSRHSSIHVVNDDGSGDRLLLKNAQWPRFDPGGKRLAFVRSRQLWTVDVDGRAPARVKTVPRAESLDW